MKETNKKQFDNNSLFSIHYKINETDIILDLKILLKEYYCGTFTEDSNTLTISLNNGQKFMLSLKEAV